MQDFLQGLVSNVLGGLIGTGVLALAALLLRRAGPQRVQRCLDMSRHYLWTLVALTFLASAVVTAAVQGLNGTRLAVLGGVGFVVGLLLIVRRFVRVRFRAWEAVARRHPWELLTGLFLITTLAQVFLPSGAGLVVPPGQVVFVVDLAPEEQMALREVLSELEPALGAKVFLMNVPSDLYVPRLDRMVADDKMKWDLIAADNNMLGVLGAKCLVQELTQYSERQNLIPRQLIPSLRGLYTHKGSGQILFAPFRPNVQIAFYNEKKFDELGLTPPRSWDDLERVARIFKEKEGVGRVALQGYPGKPTAVTVFEFVRAAGGDPLTLADERSREAFAYLQRVEPYLAPEYTATRFDTANELLIDDQVYLVVNWTFGIKVAIEDAEKREIKVFSGWKGPEREAHILGGDVLAIPRGAPSPQKAAKLIELLMSSDVQQKLFARLRWLPIRFDAYRGLPSDVETFFDGPVLDAISRAELRPTSPQWTLVENELDRAFGALVRQRRQLGSLGSYADNLRQIPPEFRRYSATKGDALEDIALAYHTSVQTLAAANGISPGASVGGGQVLLVPGMETTPCP